MRRSSDGSEELVWTNSSLQEMAHRTLLVQLEPLDTESNHSEAVP